MASSLYNLALDFSKELNYTKAIMARQGDKGITVTVKPFLNGLQMDTSGGTFTLKGTTPSNRYVDSVATSITSEEVTFSLDGTFMSEAGYYKHCYVEYRKGNQILTTQDIIFFSLGVSDISQGQADEYVSQLEELIRKYNETFDAFMAEIKGRVDSLNQQITDLTGQAKTLQDKLDALKEEISKLGNLQVMYSNSIDFGDYDYSGNPNLFVNKLESSDFYMGYHGSLTNVNGMLHFMSDGTGDIDMFTRINTPQLASGKTYTLSAKVRFDEGTTGAINKLRLVYRTSPGENILLEANNTTITIDDVGKEITIKGTANVNYQITNLDRFYISVSFSNRDKINGGFKLYDIKIEEGSTATPYQPNLLDDPYWVGKTSLGKNIANKGTTFPIKSSAYEIYKGNTEEELIIGQTYTITLKGTKPASQTFVAYNYWNVNFGDLKPVEGLTDVWSLTFTPTKLEPGLPKDLRIFQSPKETAGACRIDWLKIEKGDTRTPNIEQYKYRGIGMRDSNNPKYYVWDLEPSYVENNLATDIKVAEITGKANNYTDGKVSEINSQLTASINEVDTTAKDAQTKANANETAIKSTNSRVNEIENIITALTKEETYLLPASIVSGGSLKFTSRGGMTVATGSFKLAKDIAFGEVLVNDLPDSMINIDNNAIGTGAVTGNSVSQIYVESNTRKVVANTAMKKDQWFTVGFSYHSKLSI
ncbi:hypothetical protein IQN14_10745 [Enterococcus faecium]|uniref:coiled-coil domain-containing protein n=1 Tax=Enterococcus faecium TaxID=1352 RepID=UPI0007F52E10|nr:hypothetical protein [Enterococcus faecium]HAQ1349060.1 hypothetical protein [Enterococcus faecium Ef_RPH1]HAQ1367031.1 hypothetical protein [Enterococcus faecium Ef_RPH2]HAQ1379452.1 hypothetical protein [Enterococcus faecium Ef_aus0091]HAQ1399968.1 hypothetical protein [Enterococcus faecium Ef_aus0071]HAQ1405935.1 hypothetical protein [Enterococcus faecium Ef_aus0069]